ncbi:NmrA family NAD(P)-binding protein [Streptomyces sioyaensis]|uniref:NmrA family NAD(P)-binding protein n=1 Tax=Streptomyces sioyaensis TaxID=67364 RepID=UPI0037918596
MRTLVPSRSARSAAAHSPPDCSRVSEVKVLIVGSRSIPSAFQERRTGSAASAPSLHSTGSEDPLADYVRATSSLVRAVTENRIGRVVFQSSVGAEKRHGVGEIDGLAHTETALDDMGVDVTHLRCGYFFTNLEFQLNALRAGTLQVILPLDHPMAWVAPRDIAEVAATRLLSPTWSGRCVQAVHGPTDLTWRQVAEILSAATGRQINVERIPDSAMRTQLHQAGMTDGLVEAVLGMSTGLRENFVPEQRRTIQTTTPTTLAAWAYDHLRHQIVDAS